MKYKDFAPKINAHINQNGSITELNGTLINFSTATERFKSYSPMVNKYLCQDGSIKTLDEVLGGTAGAGVTTFNSRSGPVMPQQGDYTASLINMFKSDGTTPSNVELEIKELRDRITILENKSTFSLRRSTSLVSMVDLTPLELNGVVKSSGSSISKENSTSWSVVGGKKYEFTISSKYVQTTGSGTTALLVMQASTDGITWLDTQFSRGINLVDNNETIETSAGFVVYDDELHPIKTYFRLLPKNLVGGCDYDVALEIKEV